MDLKYRIYAILERPDTDYDKARWFDIALVLLITVNVVAVVLETVAALYSAYAFWFDAIEYVTVAVFTIEYLARITVCTEDERYARPIRGRLRYLLTPMAIVDLLAILPFFLSLFAVDGRVIRVLRIFRILRIGKLARYSVSMSTLGRVLVSSRFELLITFSLLMVMLVLSSTVMYYAENDAQPDRFSSIPAAMWWGVSTLTTVGYGDITPVTILGKMFGAVIAVIGIGMFALPAGILGSAFVEEMQKHKRSQIRKRTPTRHGYCPHCGERLEDEEPPAR